MNRMERWRTQIRLNLFASEIRNRILEDDAYRRRLGLPDGIVVTFEEGQRFAGARLLAAVRQLYTAPKRRHEVEDEDGNRWSVSKIRSDGDEYVRLGRGSEALLLPATLGFQTKAGERVRALRHRIRKSLLSEAFEQRWRPVLEKRRLTDPEARRLDLDLRATPASVAATIAAGVERLESKFSDFVPPSKDYFLELIGGTLVSGALAEFARVEGRSFVDRLVALGPNAGVERFLLLAGHSSLARCVGAEHLRKVDLDALIKSIHDSGSLIQKLGLIEALLAASPAAAANAGLASIIAELGEDESEAPQSRYHLLSSLFIFVDGELGHLGLLADWPPWARRMAALAQASLIEREVFRKTDRDAFSEIVFDRRAHEFMTQTLAELRQEPRWRPDFAVATQLRQEFLGRIAHAAAPLKEAEPTPVSEAVFGVEPSPLMGQINWIAAWMPGPFEGSDGGGSANPLPENLRELLDESLNALGSPTLKTLAPLLNLASTFTLPEGTLDKAAEAIRDAGHQVVDAGEGDQRTNLIMSLAYAAAAQRSVPLAKEIRILCRFARNRGNPYMGEAQETLLAIIAAAANKDRQDWCRMFGEWVTELAFTVEDPKEARHMRDHLAGLARRAPELWTATGGADAALEALLKNAVDMTSDQAS